MNGNRKKCINQILVTDKVIMTPDFKKKRKIYKFNFFLSSFLACTLFACCVYAEYDRNRSESVSQDILLGIEIDSSDNTTISKNEDVIIIRELSDDEGEDTVVNLADLEEQVNKSTLSETVASDGTSYYTEAILKIPSIGIEYPVLSDTSDELLKVSLNRLWGPNPNEVGNYVIVGHNYRNGKMFGKLSSIQIGDTCELTDLSGGTITYKVYTTYIVEPSDVSCTSQLTRWQKGNYTNYLYQWW